MTRPTPLSVRDFLGVDPVDTADLTAIDAVCLVAYVRNVMARVEPASDEAQALVGWMARNRQQLDLPGDLFTDNDVDRGERRRNTRPIGKTRWRSFRVALEQRLQRGTITGNDAGTLDKGFAAVTEALGLTDLDARLFEVIFRYRLDTRFERLFDCLASARGRPAVLRRYPDLFALLIGSDPMRVNARFQPDAPLMISGAIRIDADGDINVPARLVGLIGAVSARAERGRI